MEVDESVASENSFEEVNCKCNFCESRFEAKSDFMRHKKQKHVENVPVCEKFKKGICLRNEIQCWYRHHHVESGDSHHQHSGQQQQVFQSAMENPFPPEMMKVMEVMEKFSIRMEKMEEKLEKLMN